MRLFIKLKFLKNLYTQIKYRVTSKTRKQSYLYYGLGLMNKSDFLDYIHNIDFNNLYDKWIENKDRKLTPTLDRIDSSKGYVFDNLKWETLSDNVKNIKNHNRKKLKENIYQGVRRMGNKWEARIHINYKHVTIGYYDDIEEAKEAYENYKKENRKV